MSATIPDLHTEDQDYVGDADPSDIIDKLFETYLGRSADMKTYLDQQLYSEILKAFLENNYSQYQSPKKD